jgi:hypothetical protein
MLWGKTIPMASRQQGDKKPSEDTRIRQDRNLRQILQVFSPRHHGGMTGYLGHAAMANPKYRGKVGLSTQSPALL